MVSFQVFFFKKQVHYDPNTVCCNNRYFHTSSTISDHLTKWLKCTGQHQTWSEVADRLGQHHIRDGPTLNLHCGLLCGHRSHLWPLPLSCAVLSTAPPPPPPPSHTQTRLDDVWETLSLSLSVLQYSGSAIY